MFEEFSRGYYLGRLYVEPHDGDRAVMHREQHDRANQQVHDGDDGPVVMKLDGTHFPVHGAETVPADTLGLPDSFLEATHIDNPPTLTEVLLAKADHAKRWLRWFGGELGG